MCDRCRQLETLLQRARDLLANWVLPVFDPAAFPNTKDQLELLVRDLEAAGLSDTDPATEAARNKERLDMLIRESCRLLHRYKMEYADEEQGPEETCAKIVAHLEHFQEQTQAILFPHEGENGPTWTDVDRRGPEVDRG